MSMKGNMDAQYASLSGKIHTLVIDKTLSISGAAADAKATGDIIYTAKDAYDEATKKLDEIEEDVKEIVREALGDINAYSKEETVSNETKAMFGLDETAVPDDVFAELGEYKQHLWSGYAEPIGSGELIQTSITADIVLFEGGNSHTLSYSANLIVDSDFGRFDLENPQKLTINAPMYGDDNPIEEDDNRERSEVESNTKSVSEQIAALAPCYIKIGSKIYYMPAGATGGMTSTDYTVVGTVQAGSSTAEWEDDDGETYEEDYTYWRGKVTFSASALTPIALMSYTTSTTERGEVFYVRSTDRNAYPDSGSVDGYYYSYIGVPTEKMVYDTHRVGDIVRTVRNPLGENWISANGAYINRDEYPCLYDMLGNDLDKYNFVNLHTRLSINKSAKALYAYGGKLVFSDSNYKAYCADIDDISGTLTESSGSFSSYMDQIHCHDGLWVGVGYSSSYMFIYCTNNPTGNWDSKRISTSGKYVRDICYGNGKWVIVATDGSSGGNVYIYTSDDPTTGNWSTLNTTITSYSLPAQKCVAYSNGYWVIAGSVGKYSTDDTPVVWVSTDTASWNQYAIESVSSGTTAIGVHGGKFCIAYTKKHMEYDCTFFAIAEDPTGTWELKPAFANPLSHLTFANSAWLGVYNKQFYLSDGMDGDFSCLGELSNSSGSSGWNGVVPSTNVVITDDNRMVFGTGTYLYYSKEDVRARRVPVLTTENVYTYIKAKEDV